MLTGAPSAAVVGAVEEVVDAASDSDLWALLERDQREVIRDFFFSSSAGGAEIVVVV